MQFASTVRPPFTPPAQARPSEPPSRAPKPNLSWDERDALHAQAEEEAQAQAALHAAAQQAADLTIRLPGAGRVTTAQPLRAPTARERAERATLGMLRAQIARREEDYTSVEAQPSEGPRLPAAVQANARAGRRQPKYFTFDQPVDARELALSGLVHQIGRLQDAHVALTGETFELMDWGLHEDVERSRGTAKGVPKRPDTSRV